MASSPVALALRSLRESTTPIGLVPARAAVAGKTDKPDGVDPVLHLSGQGAYRIGAIPLALFVPNEGKDCVTAPRLIRRAWTPSNAHKHNIPRRLS